MKLIRTISNKDFGKPDVDESGLRDRKAARAVLVDNRNYVAVLSVEDGNFHKIPGGGLKDGESIAQALRREVMEEAGANVEVLGEIGSILEYRDGLKQYSYCFLAKTAGKNRRPEFDKKERRDGYKAPIWLPIDEAIELFKNDKPKFLRAQFMSLRDRIFLEEASKLI